MKTILTILLGLTLSLSMNAVEIPMEDKMAIGNIIMKDIRARNLKGSSEAIVEAIYDYDYSNIERLMKELSIEDFIEFSEFALSRVDEEAFAILAEFYLIVYYQGVEQNHLSLYDFLENGKKELGI